MPTFRWLKNHWTIADAVLAILAKLPEPESGGTQA